MATGASRAGSSARPNASSIARTPRRSRGRSSRATRSPRSPRRSRRDDPEGPGDPTNASPSPSPTDPSGYTRGGGGGGGGGEGTPPRPLGPLAPLAPLGPLGPLAPSPSYPKSVPEAEANPNAPPPSTASPPTPSPDQASPDNPPPGVEPTDARKREGAPRARASVASSLAPLASLVSSSLPPPPPVGEPSTRGGSIPRGGRLSSGMVPPGRAGVVLVLGFALGLPPAMTPMHAARISRGGTARNVDRTPATISSNPGRSASSRPSSAPAGDADAAA